MSRLKYNAPIYILLLLVFGVLVWYSYGWIEFDILQAKSLDEYAFHGSLLRMHAGILNLSLRGIFDFSQYLYGFPFFMLNEIVTFPFLFEAGNKYAVFLPRVLTSIFAIMCLYILDKVIEKEGASRLERVFVSIVVVSWYGFLMNATWMHPDFMMSAFLLLSFYMLLSADSNKKIYWLSVAMWGIAITVKFQAITYAPVVIIFFLIVLRKGDLSAVQAIKNGFASILAILIIYLVLNPHVIHPEGAKAWWNDLVANVESNKTNFGWIGNVSLIQKMTDAVEQYYPYPLYLLFLAYSAYVVVRDWVAKRLTSAFLSASFVIANSIYLLLFVNKSAGQYYLPVMLFSIPVIYDFILSFTNRLPNGKTMGRVLLITGVVVLNISVTAKPIALKIVARMNNQVTDREGLYPTRYEDAIANLYEIRDLIQPYYKRMDVILVSPYINFPIEHMRLKYDEVHTIYGPLDPEKHLVNQQDAYMRTGLRYQKPKFVLLSKTDVYFDSERIKQMTKTSQYVQAKETIDKWFTGTGGYEFIAESGSYFLFREL